MNKVKTLVVGLCLIAILSIVVTVTKTSQTLRVDPPTSMQRVDPPTS